MKRTIKLKESELKRMIAESVKRVLNESQRIKHYVIREDTNLANVFTEDDFNEEGYYDAGGYVDRDFNINDPDLDIVLVTYNADKAFDLCDQINDGYYND